MYHYIWTMKPLGLNNMESYEMFGKIASSIVIKQYMHTFINQKTSYFSILESDLNDGVSIEKCVKSFTKLGLNYNRIQTSRLLMASYLDTVIRKYDITYDIKELKIDVAAPKTNKPKKIIDVEKTQTQIVKVCGIMRSKIANILSNIETHESKQSEQSSPDPLLIDFHKSVFDEILKLNAEILEMNARLPCDAVIISLSIFASGINAFLSKVYDKYDKSP
jgi:hypothetical protein